jgi:hypothetical protein
MGREEDSLMKRLSAWGLALVVLVLAGRLAEARTYHFVGPHPIPKEGGGGFCYIEVEHVHVFGPPNQVEFRAHGNASLFVGDPAPYQYDGPKYSYYGPHPLSVGAVTRWDDDDRDVVYCYIQGPHWHEVPPIESAEADFKVRDGVYFYVGAYPQVYYDERPAFAKINVMYRPLRYERPVVVVDPPPEWRGDVVVSGGVQVVAPAPPVVEVDAPVVRAGAGIHAHAGIEAGMGAGVRVTAPVVEVRPPSLEISGGVSFGIGGGVHVGGPPPPTTVVVHDRPPPQVIVIDGREHEHHDNGRHRGWYKGTPMGPPGQMKGHGKHGRWDD